MGRGTGSPSPLWNLTARYHRKILCDQAERDRFVLANLPLVRSVTKKFLWLTTPSRNGGPRRRDGEGFVSFEDLEQTGTVGMLEALRRFRPSLGFRWSTYATCYISGYILRYINSSGSYGVLRVPHYQQRRYTSLLRSLASASPEGQKEFEALALKLRQVRNPVRLDREGPDCEGGTADVLCHPSPSPYQEAEQRDFLAVVETMIDCMETPRDARIVKERLGFGGKEKTLASIGNGLGLSRERVRQIAFRGRARVQDVLRGLPMNGRSHSRPQVGRSG